MAISEDLKKSPDIRTGIDFELWKLLDHTHSALSRSRELELAQYGLTPEQAGVLRTLLEKGGSTTNAEIADVMIRQYNSITTLVNRMENSGLVKKEKSAKNRKFTVSITPKGRQISERVTTNSVNLAFSGLSLKEKQKLTSYLENVVEKSRSMLLMDQKLPFLS
jgi:DNA-binding MarR family transcriptional regulator